MLERFKKAKEAEIARLRREADAGRFATMPTRRRADFCQALKGDKLAFICEYKRASPSCGTICRHLTVEDVVQEYVKNGASSLSILTEETFFDGHLSYLDRAQKAMTEKTVPLLRKDFLFDPLQILETAQTAASACLLIVKLTPDVHLLRQLREEAEAFGLTAVVEVLDEQDIALARESGAMCLQINARNLSTLAVDCAKARRLLESNPPQEGEVWISASGIKTPEDCLMASEAGFAAVLVGTTLMKNATPGKTLAALCGRDYAD